MSRQILFNNANAVPAAAGGTVRPTQVAAGRVAAFNPDNFSNGTLDLTLLTSADTVIFVQGGKTGEDPIMTSPIKVSDVVDVTRVNYIAPVAQVTTVDVETGEGFATVKVIEASAGYKPHRRMTATVKIDDLVDVAAVATALANKLNSLRPKFVTASESAGDLVLTGDLGVSFETALSDEAKGWTVTATATPNFGSGTYEHVKNVEEEAWGQQANFLNRTYLPVAPPSYADPDNTYDLITFRVKTNTTRNIGGPGQLHQEITIAVESTGTGIDLATFFGV